MLIIVSILPQAPELQRLPTLRFVNISPKNWFLTMAHCIETILQEIHLSLRWVRNLGPGLKLPSIHILPFMLGCKTASLFSQILVCQGARVRFSSESREPHMPMWIERKNFASLPSFTLCFHPRSRTFVWPLLRSWPTQKYGQYCSLLLFSIFEAWQPTPKGPCFLFVL